MKAINKYKWLRVLSGKRNHVFSYHYDSCYVVDIYHSGFIYRRIIKSNGEAYCFRINTMMGK